MAQGKNPVPKTQDGKIDKAQVKALYDASPNVEWFPFCESMGWDSNSLRANVPHARWVKEKRFRLAKQHAEELKDILAQNKPAIARDIVRTLRDYPQEHDEFLKILRGVRISLGNELAVHMRKTQVALSLTQDPPVLRKGFVNEVQAAAISLSAITQSKHRSLLLSDMTIRGIETQTEEDIQRLPEQAKQEGQALALDFTIMGWEQVTPKELQKFHETYFDKPQLNVADPESPSVEPASPEPAVAGNGGEE